MNKKVIMITTIVFLVLVALIVVWVISTVRGAANPVISSDAKLVTSDDNDNSIISVESTYYDRFSNYGEKSALYDEKIYYFSNEKDGINGIYRMDDNGENVELLVECADIKNITVYEDKLYFIGLTSYYEPYSKDKREIYSIYESDDFISSTQLRKSIIYPSAYNAYFYDDEVYLVNYGYPKWSYVFGENYILKGNTPVKIEIDDNRLFKIGLRNLYIADLKHEIPGHDIFALGIKTDDMSTEDFLYRAAFYDNNLKTRLLYSPEEGSSRQLVFDDNGNLVIIHSEKGSEQKVSVIETDSGKFNTIDTIILDISDGLDILNIQDGLDILDAEIAWLSSGNMGVVFKIIRNNEYYIQFVAAEIDLKNNVTKNIYSLNDINEYIIYFDEECIYTLEESRMHKHIYKDGEVTGTKEFIKLESGQYTFGVSGDWMFVYKQYEYLPADVLYCKINIATDKVTKNNVPFDITQHEEIFIEHND